MLRWGVAGVGRAPRRLPLSLRPAGRPHPHLQTGRQGMPVRSNPQQATAKWVQNLSASADRMTSGANNVTRSPGEAAAAAADKWLQRVTQSKGKVVANSRAVTLESWKQSYINIGIPREAQGAQAKLGQM